MAAQRGGPEDPEIWAFGREIGGGGTETEKVDKTQLQRQPEVPYKGLHLMLPAPTCYKEGAIVLRDRSVTGN